jgi:hypothetical protein
LFTILGFSKKINTKKSKQKTYTKQKQKHQTKTKTSNKNKGKHNVILSSYNTHKL